MNICFLGGSFDPPHLGHLAIAKECLKKFDKFIFLPSRQSPHKSNPPFFESKHRLKMLEIFTSNYENINIEEFEITSDSKISYTIDSVRYLTNKYLKCNLHMVVGSDLINNLDQWKDWNKIKEKVRVICVKRLGYENIKLSRNNIVYLESVKINVSSSLIKKEMLSNNSHSFANFSNMISKEIYDYILDNNLCRISE
tara:strand:- start:891 stop:1481 length:591 start_codon:yes stop_codon:yes gene_type:complete